MRPPPLKEGGGLTEFRYDAEVGRKRRWGLGVLVAFAAPLVLFSGWYAVEVTQRDRFEFLEGQRPFLSGVERHMAHHRGPEPYFEYRVYSWRADYATVVQRAGPELVRLGYRQTSPGIWEKSTLSVSVDRGRSRSHREFWLSDRRAGDPGWVTVAVSRDVPETPGILFRSLFEPQW